MSDRFYSDVPVIGPQFELTGEQAHHAVNVMRLKAGDSIGLFDIAGREFVATITTASKKSLELTIDREIESSPERGPQVSIAVALPKGDRQKFLVEKLVELGAARLIPLHTARSVAAVKDNVLRRIEKQVIEACKQCGRNRLMNVEPAQTISGLTELPASQPDTLFLIADPYCDLSLHSYADQMRSPTFRALVAIGPEGGFDPDEIGSLRDAGFLPFQIGQTILRIETAAIAATTLLTAGIRQS